MKVTVNASISITKTDTVLVFVDETFEYRHLASRLSFLRTAGDERFFRELKSPVYIPSTVNADVIIIPVKQNGDAAAVYRRAAAEGVRTAQTHRKTKVLVIVPEKEGVGHEKCAVWITEGLMLGGYIFDRYRQSDEGKKVPVDEAILVNIHARHEKTVSDAALLCTSVNRCRDMVNDITDNTNPDTIERAAKQTAKLKNVSCSVLSEAKLKSKKMNLILAVGRGSVYRPRMVVLSYKGNPSSRKWSALVGKGVTFDTGGLNLKTSAGITDMRYDMAGAAAVLYTIEAAARLGIRQNVYGVLPLVENAVDSESYRPGDVFISYAGKSVQVLNTDAEGRLILADALAYTERQLKPARIIDIATLTGACLVTFGWEYAALLSTSDDLVEQIQSASVETGEKVWRLPFDSAYDQRIKGDIAEITNITPDRKAGTIIGGTFLKEFVEQTPWAHIDIASTGWMDQQNGLYGRYATGFGVRLLVRFLASLKDE